MSNGILLPEEVREWVTSSPGQETGHGGRGHQPVTPQNDRRHDQSATSIGGPSKPTFERCGLAVDTASGVPTQLTFEDVRRYQLQLGQSGLAPSSINVAMTALRFFFRVTLRRPEAVDYIPDPRGSLDGYRSC